jgi:serine/threonine-protein kinase
VALVAGLIVSQQPSKKTVPDLTNKTNEQAQVLLRNLGLVPDATAQGGTTCPVNQVLSQEPKANQKVNEGTTVQYTWCAGPGAVKVPPLVGLPQENAKAQLENLKLLAKVDLIENAAPQGTVIETSPAANADVKEGDTITLKVSKGNLKLVPQVTGKNYTEDAARAVLTQAGFTQITTLHSPVSTAAQGGKVIAQDPQADSPRDPSTTKINITVGDYTSPTSPTGSPSPTGSGPP